MPEKNNSRPPEHSDEQSLRCELADICPGCRLPGMTYRQHLEFKLNLISHKFETGTGNDRMPGIEAVSHPNPFSYRIRGVFRVFHDGSSYRLGMRSKNPEKPWVCLDRCICHHPDLNRVIDDLQRCWNQAHNPDPASLFHMVGITLSADGQHRISLFAKDSRPEELKSRPERPLTDRYSIHLLSSRGTQSTAMFDPFILSGREDILFPVDFGGTRHLLQALPGVWTPVSYGTSEIVTRTIFESLGSLEVQEVLDMGCGIGSHGLALSSFGYRVIGIDSSRSAVRSAELNKIRLKDDRIRFFNGRVDHFFRKYASRRVRFDAVICHSMRLPVGESALKMLKNLESRILLLISPSIFSLTRDIQSLTEDGWIVRRLVLADQIPWTNHLTGIGIMSRKNQP